MPSPFPGVDPYLEGPEIWPDFQHSLAAEIRAELNLILPTRYCAMMDVRMENGDDSSNTSIRHNYVEICDLSQRRRHVTLIEFATPFNKKAGASRSAYEQLERDAIASQTSLVGLDMIRTGDRLLPQELGQSVRKIRPSPDYLVTIHVGWSHSGKLMKCILFPWTIRQPLPTIPIPLGEGESNVQLSLQHVADRAYDHGPYRRGAVDYRRPPVPPLSDTDAAWARELLARL